MSRYFLLRQGSAITFLRQKVIFSLSASETCLTLLQTESLSQREKTGKAETSSLWFWFSKPIQEDRWSCTRDGWGGLPLNTLRAFRMPFHHLWKQDPGQCCSQSSHPPSVVSNTNVNVLWGRHSIFPVHWRLNKRYLIKKKKDAIHRCLWINHKYDNMAMPRE